MNTAVRSLVLVALTAPHWGCSENQGAQVASAQAGPQAQARPQPQQPAPAPSQAELVARGEQLLRLGGCHDCHTPMQFDPKLGMPVPRNDRMLSGHPEGGPEPQGQPGQGDQGVIGATFTSFKLPFGTVYARNLTPDRDTGLGTWTADDFITTMRTGHRRGAGRVLLPPMPWQNLSQQPESELRAMFAYLQSIPPIQNRVPDPRVPAEVIAGIAQSYEAAAKAAAH